LPTYPSDETFVSILGVATIIVIQFYPGKKKVRTFLQIHVLNKHKFN